MPGYRYTVFGRVQGVGYRYFALRQAELLGIAGFARNHPNGSVEVVAEGSEESLAALEERLREGPSFAAVDGVQRDELEPRGGSGFHIR